MALQIDDKSLPDKEVLKTATPISEQEFEYLFSSLIFDEPFLGSMALYVERRPDPKCKTAYVKITKDGTFVMGYDPLWMGSLTKNKRIGVIKHEFFHLIFWHLTARRPMGKRLKLWNLATDAASNSIIGEQELPEGCILPGKPLGPKADKELSRFFENLPTLQAAEYYLSELVKFQEEWKKNNPDSNDDYGFCDNVGTVDDHDFWDDIDETMSETAHDAMKDIIEKIMNAGKDNARFWGSIPEKTRVLIKTALNREIPWEKIIESFLGRARSRQETSSIKIINRRYPYIHPGLKKKTQSRVWIFQDESGSVSDADLSLFFGTLAALSKIVDEFTVFPFDTQVYEENKIIWKTNQKIESVRVATGGTDFDCVANFLNNHRGACDAAIILTDGYAPQIKQIYGVDVMWVITTNGTLDPARKGQRVIKMSDPKNIKRI